MSKLLFRMGEVVRIPDILGEEFGTIVCSGDFKEDDVRDDQLHAIVLVYENFKRDKDDNRIRDVDVTLLEKQYSEDIEITAEAAAPVWLS